ncbi:hypothetical protein JHK86_039743 [Glycine max]|nr:hypothetical protein JHK86_039743 [Glycine max]
MKFRKPYTHKRIDWNLCEAEAAVAGDEPMVNAAAQATGAETDAQDTDGEQYSAGPSKHARDSDIFDTYCSPQQRDSSGAGPSHSMGLEAYITGNRVSSYRQGSDRPMGIQSARDSTRASSIIAMDIICHSVNGDSMESVKNYPGDLDDVHFPSSSMYGNVDMNETSELDNNNQAQQSTYLQTIIEVVCGDVGVSRKYQIVHAFSIIKEAEMPCEEISNHKISHEENHLLPYSQDSPKLEALKCLTFMAENLRKQIQSLLVSVHNTPCNVNVGFGLMKTLIDCPLQLVALVEFCGAYSHLPRTKQMLKIVMKKKKC